MWNYGLLFYLNLEKRRGSFPIKTIVFFLLIIMNYTINMWNNKK